MNKNLFLLLKLLLIFIVLTVVFFSNVFDFSSFPSKLKELLVDQRPAKQFLFCIILTDKYSLDTKAAVAYESWAHRCDDHRFLTIIPDDLRNKKNNHSFEFTYKYDLNVAYNKSQSLSLKLIKYNQKHHYIKLLQPPGLEIDTYKNLSHKVYLAFKQIYLSNPNFQWYLKCDHDTFIYDENLRKFLSDKNSTLPLAYGRPVTSNAAENSLDPNKPAFLSGGAGYVLSNEAFTRIGKKLNKSISNCGNMGGAEDVGVSSCLIRLGCRIGISFDEKVLCRFHSNSIFYVFKYRVTYSNLDFKFFLGCNVFFLTETSML
jgi:hypothetical protein